jgi:hypothetical protein
MLAAAAIVWITLDADVSSPHIDVGRGWTIGAQAGATFRPMFVYPDFQSGVALLGGFRLAHGLSHNTTIAMTGRAGATYVDSWQPLFEVGAELRWRDAFEVRGGARHDDQLRREGALADFRDPTGRLFVDVTALPLRAGPLGLGATAHYERAMPGTGRLPSGAYAAFIARFTWPRYM